MVVLNFSLFILLLGYGVLVFGEEFVLMLGLFSLMGMGNVLGSGLFASFFDGYLTDVDKSFKKVMFGDWRSLERMPRIDFALLSKTLLVFEQLKVLTLFNSLSLIVSYFQDLLCKVGCWGSSNMNDYFLQFYSFWSGYFYGGGVGSKMYNSGSYEFVKSLVIGFIFPFFLRTKVFVANQVTSMDLVNSLNTLWSNYMYFIIKVERDFYMLLYCGMVSLVVFKFVEFWANSSFVLRLGKESESASSSLVE